MADQGRAQFEPFAPGIAARVRPGLGDPVLWVHGYTVDSTVWADLWSLLPGQAHYGIDLPGHGASSPLVPGTTLAELGERLAAGAMGRCVRHVVGLSLGSMIALQVVLARPEAFATLTLAAPAVGGGPVDADVGVRYRELHALYRRRGPGPWLTELWMRSPPATFAHAGEPLRARLAAVIDGHSWREFDDPGFGIGGLTRQAQDVGALARAPARLLVLTGEHELPAFRQTARILQALRPDARAVALPGVGHLCVLQAPETSARLLSEHWAGSAPGDSGAPGY
jgi:pimeloyl-ACP methyl ester carboxylesterase